MTNLELARHHGLIVENLINDGRWHRVSTVDKPHSSNGAYCVNNNGCITIQNWALDEQAHFYSENALPSDSVKNRGINKQIYQDKIQLNKKAATKAGWILNNSEMAEHPYLAKKGFEGVKGLVHENKLVIPMRINGDLVGVQMIDDAGNKKFLYGQQCKNAVHIIGQGRINVVCEGYASGLSAHKALVMASIPSRVFVCFSANNMIEVAKGLKKGITIADNDVSKTGENAAIKIGWDYLLSDTQGNDFNDETSIKSYFKLSQELKKIAITLNK